MKQSVLVLLCIWAARIVFAQSVDNLAFVQYNLLKYGDFSCAPIATKNARFQLIFNVLRPDILTVNEIAPNETVVNSLRANALTFNPAMQPTTFGNSSGSDIVNMLYYNADKLGYLGHQAITGNVRDVDVYRLYHLASTRPGDTTDLYCITAHFKSSQGISNVDARANTAQDIVNWLQAHPEVQRYTISGDFNLYSSTEPAFQTLLTRFEDPSGQSNGWQGPAFAALQTQSPADGTEPCAVTGGMDDRFDFILTSPGIYTGTGRVAVVPNSYRTFGNDGVSYNEYLQCEATTSVSSSVCAALRTASDHLPVTMQLRIQNPFTATQTPTLAPCRLLNNPVRETLRIVGPDQPGSAFTGHIVNQFGQVMTTDKLEISAGNMLVVPVEHWATGIYWLVMQNNTGIRQTLRFVKI